MRKVLSALLVLTMILSLVPAFAVQTSAAREGIWQYEVSDGEATITGVNIPVSGHIDIPSTLGGYQVTSIGPNAFSGCTGLTSIAISEGVTSIGNYAFSGCTGLTNISISESVTKIGWSAFSGCTGLIRITVNSNNRVYKSSGNCLIERDTKTLIFGCKTSVIPTDGSVTSIENSAFEGCTGLTSITIPSSVTKIYAGAFSGCTDLTSITIREGVTEIGNAAFEDCTGLTSITIPSSMTKIGESAFSGCTGLTSITIPEGVTKIGSSAFSGCTGLTNISISESVTSIGWRAFGGCTGLVSIIVKSNNRVYKSSGNCLIERDTKTLIFGCKTSVIPADGSVTSIEDYAFSGCTGLTNITIPSSVTEIGFVAFSGCTGLTDITIPSSVTEIGPYAFSGCTGLTRITISEGVTVIGGYAFEGCTGLTSITIPSSVTEIGESAFSGCTGLTSITVNSNNRVYRSSGNCLIERDTKTLIFGCNTSVIPTDRSVASIGYYAFSGCTGLTSITIPSSVTEIGDFAFGGCTGLTSITVDESNPVYHGEGNCIIEISSKTLIAGCKTSVIPADGSVTEIGNYAFDGCTGLTNITIPSSVTEIGVSAFGGCTGLTSMTVDESNPVYHGEGNCIIEISSKTLIAGCKTSVIPADGSVTEIGYPAFYGCIGLTSITIPSSVTAIGFSAFSGCTGLTSITIPSSVTAIGVTAFYGCDNLTIYGIKDSYAETYANERGIPFVEYRELTDTSSGVTVGGGVPENAELSVVVKEQTSEKAVFDISLVADGVMVQPNGSVRVALPVPQGMNGADMRVYHIADNGAKTDMNAVYSIGFMVFETDHFSLYSIEPTLNIVYGDADGNGEVDITDAMLVFYHVAKKELLPEEALVRCNVNDDNEVDIADAMAIFYFVAKKTDSVRQ